MRPLTYPKSLWISGLFRRSIFVTLAFWMLLQIPIVCGGIFFGQRKQLHSQTEKRKVLEGQYLELLQSLSRFGDLGMARGQVIQLGSGSGLLGIFFCDGEEELLGKFNQHQCPKSGAGVYRFQFNGRQIEVNFVWAQFAIDISEDVFWTWWVTSIFSLFVVLGSTIATYRMIQIRLEKFSSDISKLKPESGDNLDAKFDLPELTQLVFAVKEMRIGLRRLFKLEMENENLKISIKLANQIAHDIRSPLTALEVAINDKKFSEDLRGLIEGASKRIRNIADDLLLKARADKNNLIVASGDETSVIKDMSVEFDVSSITKQIINEKLAELAWRKKPLEMPVINFSAPESPIMKKGDSTAFTRILSNVLNNSIEAKHPDREMSVTVSVREYRDSIVVATQDNGIGMDSTVLSKVGEEGFSRGKVEGNGLGLFMAKKALAAEGGSLEIVSKPGHGTIVSIKFKSQFPEAT